MTQQRSARDKQHRVHVTSVRDWLNHLSFDGLIGRQTPQSTRVLLICCAVAEVYSNYFGPCTAIEPTVKQIMLSYDDAESRIKWLIVRTADTCIVG